MIDSAPEIQGINAQPSSNQVVAYRNLLQQYIELLNQENLTEQQRFVSAQGYITCCQKLTNLGNDFNFMFIEKVCDKIKAPDLLTELIIIILQYTHSLAEICSASTTRLNHVVRIILWALALRDKYFLQDNESLECHNRLLHLYRQSLSNSSSGNANTRPNIDLTPFDVLITASLPQESNDSNTTANQHFPPETNFSNQVYDQNEEDFYHAIEQNSLQNNMFTIPVAQEKTTDNFLYALKVSGFFSLYCKEDAWSKIDTIDYANQRYFITDSDALIRTILAYFKYAGTIRRTANANEWDSCFSWISAIKNIRSFKENNAQESILKQLSAWAFRYSYRLSNSNFDQLKQSYETFCKDINIVCITFNNPVEQIQITSLSSTTEEINMPKETDSVSNNTNIQATQNSPQLNQIPLDIDFFQRLSNASGAVLKIKLENNENKIDFINYIQKKQLFWGNQKMLETAVSTAEELGSTNEKIKFLYIKGEKPVSNIRQWIERVTKISKIIISYVANDSKPCLAEIFTDVEALRHGNKYRTATPTILRRAKSIYIYVKQMIESQHEQMRDQLNDDLDRFYTKYCTAIINKKNIRPNLKNYNSLKSDPLDREQIKKDLKLIDETIEGRKILQISQERTEDPSSPIYAESNDNQHTDQESDQEQQPEPSNIQDLAMLDANDEPQFQEQIAAIAERKRKLAEYLANMTEEQNLQKKQKAQNKQILRDSILSSSKGLEEKIKSSITLFPRSITTKATEAYRQAVLQFKTKQLIEEGQEVINSVAEVDRIRSEIINNILLCRNRIIAKLVQHGLPPNSFPRIKPALTDEQYKLTIESQSLSVLKVQIEKDEHQLDELVKYKTETDELEKTFQMRKEKIQTNQEKNTRMEECIAQFKK